MTKKALIQASIPDEYLPETRIQVYTDDPPTSAMQDRWACFFHISHYMKMFSQANVDTWLPTHFKSQDMEIVTCKTWEDHSDQDTVKAWTSHGRISFHWKTGTIHNIQVSHGHNLFNVHMHWTFKMSSSPQCLYGMKKRFPYKYYTDALC